VPVNHRRTIAGFKCRPVNVRSDDEPVTDIGMAQAIGGFVERLLYSALWENESIRHTYSECKNCVRHKAAVRLTSRVL